MSRFNGNETLGMGANVNSGMGMSNEFNGEIYNDYINNKAVSSYASARGHQTVAGVRGFNILAVDVSSRGYTLDSVEGLAVGDVISVVMAENVLNGAIIGSIVDNVVHTDLFIGREMNTLETTDTSNNYLYVVTKPEIGTEDISEYASAEGYKTKALGKAAHTEGANNISSGWYSHTEGRGNEATDYNAHAEGRETKAKANSAHTEGRLTEALAPYTHAEGYNTKARANGSHTEGTDTETTGWYAHAENYGTKASGMASHAQNARNKAAGDNSHAGGSDSEAHGSQTFVHGLGLKSKTFKGYRILGIRRKADNSRDVIKVETTEGLRNGGLDQIGIYINGVYTRTYVGAVYDAFEFETTGNAPLTYVPGSYMIVENNDVGYEIGEDNQHIVGKFNKPVSGALFVVGNGTDDANRSNALEVYGDGTYNAGRPKDQGITHTGNLMSNLDGMPVGVFFDYAKMTHPDIDFTQYKPGDFYFNISTKMLLLVTDVNISITENKLTDGSIVVTDNSSMQVARIF